MCSQNLSLSKSGGRCRSLHVVLIAIFRFNALTSSLKFSRCVYWKIKIFVASLIACRVFAIGVYFFIFEDRGSTYHVCCCSDNSCLIGEFAVLDQNMFSFSGIIFV